MNVHIKLLQQQCNSIAEVFEIYNNYCQLNIMFVLNTDTNSIVTNAHQKANVTKDIDSIKIQLTSAIRFYLSMPNIWHINI